MKSILHNKKTSYIKITLIFFLYVGFVYVASHLIWVHWLRDFVDGHIADRKAYAATYQSISMDSPSEADNNADEEIEEPDEPKSEIYEADVPKSVETAEPKVTKISNSIGKLSDVENVSDTADIDNPGTEKSVDELDEKYRKLFAPAKDELDYLWDTDYDEIKGTNDIRVCDSKAYEVVFNEKKPTLEDIKQTVWKNEDIPEKFKEFIINYAGEYLNAYPDTDFSVLRHNLKTLKIFECTKDDIRIIASSTTALSCYLPSINEICIYKNCNIEDKSSDDYIVLSHEITHAARITKSKLGNKRLLTNLISDKDFGYYIDEAVNTYFVYQLQGLNKKSFHYTIPSNYFRIFMDALGNSYTGSDYMNHSINYLAKKMDEFMGDEMYAYHILALLESLSKNYYEKNAESDYNDFTELNEYAIRMYLKKHLKSGMSRMEAEELFADFMDEITFNYENLTREYIALTEDDFRPEFERVIKDYEIN